MYLLVQKDRTVELNSLSEVTIYLDIKVNRGIITFQGIKDTISYPPDEWKEASILDFIRHRLNKFYPRTGIKLYKAELL